MGLNKKQTVMMAILLGGVLLAVLNQTLLSPAFPSIMAEFAIDATTVQWLTSGYSLVEAIVIPMSAYLIGRFSTRKLFITSFFFFVAGSLLAAWSPSFWVLLLGRICQAICTGVIMPMVMTVILLIFPREKRGAAMGLVGLIIGFAPAIGPSVAGLIIDSTGWHILFLIVAACAVLVVTAAIIFLKNYGEFKRVPLDILSVFLSSVGLVCVLYGLSSFTSTSNYLLTGALVIAGAILIVFFIRRQSKLEIPMLKMDVFKSRRFAVAVGSIALMQAALVGLIVILPLFIQIVLGKSATVSGLATLPGALIGAGMSLVAGRMFDNHGARKLALFGNITATVGTVILCLLDATSSIFILIAANAIVSLGIQFIMTPLNTWGVNSLSNNVIQHANSLASTINQVAGSFGTALIVSLSALSAFLIPDGSAVEQAYLGYHIAFIGVAVLFFIALSIIFVSVRDKKSDATAPTQTFASAETTGAGLAVLTENVMNSAPHYLPDTATVHDAVILFSRYETSGIPIINEERRLVGFLSDGDIMKYLGKSDVTLAGTYLNLYRIIDNEEMQERVDNLMKLNVMQLATKRVLSVESTTPVDEACHILAEKRIKKLPVVKDGILVGTLSRRNVIHEIMQELKQA